MRISRGVAAMCAASVLTVATMGPALGIATPTPTWTPTMPPGPNVNYSLGAGGTAPPPIYASGWLIADADSGEILAERGADAKRPPASTLKVLTAVSLLPHLIPSSTYRATRQDEDAEGSHAGIVAGATYTVADLTHGLLLPSGNDAASAIALAYGGTKLAVAHMNAEARRLGATHTHAVNPSGLDADGQVSTPKDLASLFRVALTYPELRQTISASSFQFPGGPAPKGKKRESYQIYTQDRLLLHGYQGLIGGKSGYTTNAGRTFVGAAARHGHTLIYSLMGTETATEDAARDLLDWGFANVGKVAPVGHLANSTPRLGPIERRAAAQYSVDGRLLSASGRTAGAAVTAEKQSTTVNQPNRASSVSSSESTLRIDWLVPALLVFLLALATFFVILAARTFRTHD